MQITLKNVLLSIIFLYILYCSIVIGNMWDSAYHLAQGKNKLNYLFSLGKINKELVWDKYIPGISFAITAFFTSFVPKKFEFEMLHILNMFISLSGVYGISKITKILFNKRVSYIVFLLLLTYPAFFGHVSINPKDTIIAISFIWVGYFVLKYLINNNKYQNNINLILKISFFIALGTGVRLGFSAVIIPFLIFLVLEIFYFKKFINKKFSNKIFFYDFIRVIIFSYILIIIFWPQVHANIFTLPFKFFLETIEIVPGAPAAMLSGQIFLTSNTPKNYILFSFILKTPEYILLLYSLSIYFLITKNVFFTEKYLNFNYKLFFLLFTMSLTYLLFYVSPYPLYDGMRLFLYIIPFFLIIPCLGLDYIISNIKLKSCKFYLVLISFLGIIFFVNFLSLTPYHYVYFNYLNGKNSEAVFKHENDYLGTSINELIKKSEFLNKKRNKLAFCGASEGIIEIALNKHGFKQVELVDRNNNYDYILLVNRVNWDTISNLNTAKTCFNSYPGDNISAVKRNGMVLSNIRKY